MIAYSPLKITSFLFFFLLPFLVKAQSTVSFFQEANHFFQQYTKDGTVQYAAIKSAPAPLHSLTQQISEFKFENLDPITQKAFLINAYNLLTIQKVIAHYPIASPLEINGFFTKKTVQIGGEKQSLNHLEKELLLSVYQDPRLHFVLVCAAESCPSIAPFAYHPDQLEQQLDQQTKQALDDPNFIQASKNQIEDKIYISEIFRWYANDFSGTKGIRNFINQYRSKKISEATVLKYYDYSWRLNDIKSEEENVLIIPYRASTLLYKGEMEIKLFNSLYTQRDFDGFNQLNSRSTYFSAYNQYLLGTNKNFNWGFDLVYKSNVINAPISQSPFKALAFQTGNSYETFACKASNANRGLGSHCFREGYENLRDTLQKSDGQFLQTKSAIGLSHIGPKFKISPWKKISGLTFQQTLYLPIEKSVDGQYISFSQLFYDRQIGTKFQFFAEVGLWTTLHPTFRVNNFYKLFFSYFPVRRLAVYATTSLPAEYGMGTKYSITQNLDIEFLYTYYLPIESVVGHSRPMTFNFGIRWSR